MYMYYLIGYRMQNCRQEAPSEYFLNKQTNEVEQGRMNTILYTQCIDKLVRY